MSPQANLSLLNISVKSKKSNSSSRKKQRKRSVENRTDSQINKIKHELFLNRTEADELENIFQSIETKTNLAKTRVKLNDAQVKCFYLKLFKN